MSLTCGYEYSAFQARLGTKPNRTEYKQVFRGNVADNHYFFSLFGSGLSGLGGRLNLSVLVPKLRPDTEVSLNINNEFN
jgi:hypothetical protein